MKDLDTIYIGRGLGSILFGNTTEQVIQLLGKPDFEKTDEDGDIDFIYEHQKLTFTFWSDLDYYLGHIGTERETAVLNGCKLIGKEESEIKIFIQKNLKAEISEEDGCIHENGDILRWIEIDELNIAFWFLNGILYLIEWFCEWTDDETPRWPREIEEEKG